MTNLSKVLVILSGASYLAGSIYLALSIRWQSEILSKNDDSRLAKSVRDMGSPGRTDIKRLRIGIILSALGYVLLLISIFVG